MRILALASLAACSSGPSGVFPSGFLWGSATAAHQVESADPPATDWAAWEATPGKIANGDRASAGPDAWDRYDADFALAQAMGHNAYRFSIEWARVEPTPGTFDEAAIARYKAMIASMKAHGLKPVATLWHFTTPSWAAGDGGWEKKSVADAFVSYVQRVVPRFQDDVDFWITLNEPMVYVIFGYFYGSWPPGRSFALDDAVAAHGNLIDAHVRAYDAIHAAYGGRKVTVTIASHFVAFDPKTPADAQASAGLERIVDFAFLDAVIKGDLDAKLDGTIAHRADYAGKLDVIGVNYYQHNLVAAANLGIIPGLPSEDPGAALKSDLGWELYPAGMGRALDALWGRYRLPLVVTENGIADAADTYRGWYIVSHVEEVQKAVQRGVDVRGYLHWSLIDNFEWAEGFRARFGLAAVDYAAAEKTRTVRASAAALMDIIRTNEVTADVVARWPMPGR